MQEERVSVAVLGATGVVGQKIVRLLSDHPRFKVGELCASSAKKGALYGDFFWGETLPLPEAIAKIRLVSTEEVTSSFAISALPSSVAKEEEDRLLAKGIHVVTNASCDRMQPDVPLFVPEVNAQSLRIIEHQSFPGKRLAATNCVVAIVAPALAPLLELGKLQWLGINTLQAVSGAGRGGVSGFDIQNNTIPFIANEEEKIAVEIQKIFNFPRFPIDVNANRVPVLHGHTAVLHLIFKERLEEKQVFFAFEKQLERWPDSYCFYSDPTGPQPRYLNDDDMRVHIGRVRVIENRVTLVVTGHNLVRGAAGTCVSALELLSNYILKEKEVAV